MPTNFLMLNDEDIQKIRGGEMIEIPNPVMLGYLAAKPKQRKTFNPDGYKCEDCGQVFVYPAALGRHRYVKHPDTYKPAESTLRNRQKQTAVASRVGKEPTKCPRCGKRFPTASGLGGHMAWHYRQDKAKKASKEPKELGKTDQQ